MGRNLSFANDRRIRSLANARDDKLIRGSLEDVGCWPGLAGNRKKQEGGIPAPFYFLFNLGLSPPALTWESIASDVAKEISRAWIRNYWLRNK